MHFSYNFWVLKALLLLQHYSIILVLMSFKTNMKRSLGHWYEISGKDLNTPCIALLDPLIGTCKISSLKSAIIIYFSFWCGLAQCLLKN